MSDETKKDVQDPQEEPATPVSVADDGTIKVDFGKVGTDEPAAGNNEPATATPDPVDPVDQEPVDTPADDTKEPGNDPEPSEEEDDSALVEVTGDDEEDDTPASAAIKDPEPTPAEDPKPELPEGLQKLASFMDETGGSLEDFVRLNTDFASLNEDQLLREYYESTMSHLDKEDVDFLMSDNFSYDEELDEEDAVRRKKLAKKEALSKAKGHFDKLKDQYYTEVKAGSRLTEDQKKAVDFFNRYNAESKEANAVAERQAEIFRQQSDNVFSDKFQGFDYKVGDKTYRFKVKNPSEVKETQGDINNFIKKFLNEKNEMSDAKGYHKSLFTAMNADQVAQHFYEQGKADAIKESMSRTKNVDMSPRGVHGEVKTSNGWSMRAVPNDADSSKLRVKFKK